MSNIRSSLRSSLKGINQYPSLRYSAVPCSAVLRFNGAYYFAGGAVGEILGLAIDSVILALIDSIFCFISLF